MRKTGVISERLVSNSVPNELQPCSLTILVFGAVLERVHTFPCMGTGALSPKEYNGPNRLRLLSRNAMDGDLPD